MKEKELGNAAYKKKDFATALRHYEEACKLDPNSMTYLSNQAGKRQTLVIELSSSLQAAHLHIIYAAA